ALWDVLWHFGRSCVASLERDVLLEAVIGLDALLVPGSGESTYRFSLHGAVLIGAGTGRGTQVKAELQDLYNARSGAAHGDRRGANSKARRARQVLAQAIERTAALILDGKLDMSKKLPHAIQQYVIERATL